MVARKIEHWEEAVAGDIDGELYGRVTDVPSSAASRMPTSAYLALGLTMGQWLSLPMIVAGLALFWWGARDSAK